MLTLRACYDHATMWGNIHASDSLVMSFEFILKCKLVTRPVVELDVVVSGDCECLPVGGERMVSDGMVEQMMDFWASHVEQ